MRKILIVDDDKAMRALLRLNLEDCGFECFLADNGMKAVETAREKLPDLIILDLRLPKLSGEEVCKEIKRNKVTKHIPIIMLSAKDADADKVVGKVIGADCYITKPCDMKKLLESVHRLIGIQKGAS